MQAKTRIATLGEILTSRVRMEFRYRVNFEQASMKNIDDMTSWCKENCKDLWRVNNNYSTYFQFSDDSDATMFMLRWGGASGNKLA
jgi:hypothetical protein